MTTELPAIAERRETRLSPWTSVIERHLVMPGRTEVEAYHALRQADYVSVFALTERGHVPLVRQYRPAVERYTLELPGGLLDAGEDPASCALRELREETGHESLGAAMPLGRLAPDTGRLDNALWAFAVRVSDVRSPAWQAEPGMEVVLATRAELREWLVNGRFDHALHIALIGLAVLHGFLEWER